MRLHDEYYELEGVVGTHRRKSGTDLAHFATRNSNCLDVPAWHTRAMALPHVSDAQRRARLGTSAPTRRRPARPTTSPPSPTRWWRCTAPIRPRVYLSLAARMATPSLAAVRDALHDDPFVGASPRHAPHALGVHARRRCARCTVRARSTSPRRSGSSSNEWVAASGIERPTEWIAPLSDATLAARAPAGTVQRAQLGKAVPELTTKIQVGAGKFALPQSAHTRLLLNLGFDGTIVRTAPTGSWVSSEYQLVRHRPTGCPTASPARNRRPLAPRSAARYLRAFGPVTTADVQWWTGWTAGATRAALAACDAVEVDLDGGRTGWMLPDDRRLR